MLMLNTSVPCSTAACTVVYIMHARMHACMYVCMYACTCVCMRAQIRQVYMFAEHHIGECAHALAHFSIMSL